MGELTGGFPGEWTNIEALRWCAEEACFNAWPSARVLVMGGWLLRAGAGTSRRSNSLNPVRGGATDPGPILAEARRTYDDLGQDLIFRSISIHPGVDDHLDRAGFAPGEGETLTLFADLTRRRSPPGDVELTPTPTPLWLRARGLIARADPAADAAIKATLGLLSHPARFALARAPEGVASIAFGVLSRELLVVEGVATSCRHRRQGYARSAVGALMRWGRSQGVRGACLQVLADNATAVALYRGLGFDDELYSYHYRRLVRSSGSAGA